LKFGAIVSETGPDSSSLYTGAGAYKAWADWTNANGGINGHPVDVVVLDDKQTPSVGLADVHTLIDADHVLAISSLGIGAIPNLGPYAAQKGVPVVGGPYVASWGTSLGHPNVFLSQSSIYAEYAIEGSMAKSLGATKLGDVLLAQAAGSGQGKQWGYIAQQNGLTHVKEVAVSFGQPSYVAECLALKQAGADVLGEAVPAQPLDQLVDQCAEQGYHPIVLGQDVLLEPNWLTDPNWAKGASTIPTFPYFDTSIPGVATFNQVMHQYYPSLFKTEAIGAATEAWAAMTVIGAAAKLGNLGSSSTPAQMTAALHAIPKGSTFDGVTPPLDYANGGNLQPPTCAYAAKVSQGQFQLLNGGSRICVPFSEAQAVYNIQSGK
jgi:branched-chain amino acid transport system substrate-binding protein